MTKVSFLTGSLLALAFASSALAAAAVNPKTALDAATSKKVLSALADRGAKKSTGNPLAGLSVDCAGSTCTVTLVSKPHPFAPGANGPFFNPNGKIIALSAANSLSIYRGMQNYDGQPKGKGATRYGGDMHAGASLSCDADAVDVAKAKTVACKLQIFPVQK